MQPLHIMFLWRVSKLVLRLLVILSSSLFLRVYVLAVGRNMVQTDPGIFPLDPIKNEFALLQWQKKIHSEKVRNGLGLFFKSFIFTQKIINQTHI